MSKYSARFVRNYFFSASLRLCGESFFCAAGAIVIAFTLIYPANAALQLCNRTSYVLYTATGIQKSSQILTQGWTRIIPGDCATPIAEPLKAPAYFVYAQSSQAKAQAPRIWGGQFKLCAKNANFSLSTPAAVTRCEVEGAIAIPFAPVATGGAMAWTTTFTDQANLASPDAARHAGAARLLGELGYAVDAKGFDAALAKFQAHAKLSPHDGPAALFTALEAEAGKGGMPLGYTICNDADTPLWAAIAVKAGPDFVSRGWWQVAAASCTTVIADALGREPVYLNASRHGNARLVSGPALFCIANATFEIRGRDRCAARGYASQGFLATNLKGLAGYAAHIGKAGLAAP